MDLQLFSEEVIETEEVEVEEVETEETETEEVKEVNLQELLEKDENIQKQFQSELDKAITKALNTREKKFDEERAEAERRSKLTAEELQAEKLKELELKEQEIKSYELKLKKVEYFNENKVPLELLDYVNVNEVDEIGEKTQTLMNIINQAVAKEKDKILAENGYEPSEKKQQGLSIEDFKNMTTEEINANWDKLV